MEVKLSTMLIIGLLIGGGVGYLIKGDENIQAHKTISKCVEFVKYIKGIKL